jgi:hypothetical protein
MIWRLGLPYSVIDAGDDDFIISGGEFLDVEEIGFDCEPRRYCRKPFLQHVPSLYLKALACISHPQGILKVLLII